MEYVFCFKMNEEAANDIGVNPISRFKVKFSQELTPEEVKSAHESFGHGLALDYHIDNDLITPISEGEYGQLKEEYADDEEAMEEIFGADDEDEDIIDIVLPHEETKTEYHFKDTREDNQGQQYYKAVVISNKVLTGVEYEKKHNELGHELAEKLNIDFCFIHKIDKEEYETAFNIKGETQEKIAGRAEEQEEK